MCSILLLRDSYLVQMHITLTCTSVLSLNYKSFERIRVLFLFFPIQCCQKSYQKLLIEFEKKRKHEDPRDPNPEFSWRWNRFVSWASHLVSLEPNFLIWNVGELVSSRITHYKNLRFIKYNQKSIWEEGLVQSCMCFPLPLFLLPYHVVTFPIYYP